MKILFMCVANSARSQVAEGLAKLMFGARAEIHSAGSHPSQPNPYAVRILSELGADVKALRSKTVEELPKEFLASIDYVITLCAEEVCPTILSAAKKLHWPLPDPAGCLGTDAERMEVFRQTCNQISLRLNDFIGNLGSDFT
ncbi:MAG: arsenate reductase ArsC [Proteobacteria bacterium]|nr:arsenate reductase ArsC [Pseudomonadota bacterium]